MQWEAGRRPSMYPGGPSAVAPGVHAALWAGDPAAAHLEVAKRRVSICFPGDGRAERLLCSQCVGAGWVYNTVSAARGG